MDQGSFTAEPDEARRWSSLRDAEGKVAPQGALYQDERVERQEASTRAVAMMPTNCLSHGTGSSAYAARLRACGWPTDSRFGSERPASQRGRDGARAHRSSIRGFWLADNEAQLAAN